MIYRVNPRSRQRTERSPPREEQIKGLIGTDYRVSSGVLAVHTHEYSRSPGSGPSWRRPKREIHKPGHGTASGRQDHRHDVRADGAVRHADRSATAAPTSSRSRRREGDIMRLIGPARDREHGPVFLNATAASAASSLDLKKPAGREAVLRLIADADVLVYNVRPQAMARLGLGYDDVAAVNPRIIYAGLFGFGQDGPYAAKPAYDDLIQGGSGAVAPDRGARRRAAALRADARSPTASSASRRSAPSSPALPPRAHRQRPARRRADVRDHGEFRARRPSRRPHLRSAAGPGRLRAPARQDRRPYATSDGFICVIVYNDKQWKLLRAHRPRRARRSALCHLRQPACQHRCRLWRARPHPREAHHRRVAGDFSTRPTSR